MQKSQDNKQPKPRLVNREQYLKEVLRQLEQLPPEELAKVRQGIYSYISTSRRKS
jgi:hypothetical protein